MKKTSRSMNLKKIRKVGGRPPTSARRRAEEEALEQEALKQEAPEREAHIPCTSDIMEEPLNKLPRIKILGFINPEITFIIVDLPAPLGPSKPNICPRGIFKDMLSRI